MSYLNTRLLSHTQRVKSLYKRALRETQAYYIYRNLFRYQAVLMRARFDENKDEIDLVKAKKLLEAGEKELWENQHPQPLKFCNSPGGNAYGRVPYSPDAILDTWHPLEKAAYPDYFARRERRKTEFIERWEKKYGNAETSGH